MKLKDFIELRQRQLNEWRKQQPMRPRLDNYFSALNRDDLNFYYKYHKHGKGIKYPEEII